MNEKNESKSLAVFERFQDPLMAAMQLGDAFASSGMFGCTKPTQGAILALQCMTSGMTPFEVMATYHLLDGKLSMRADAMLARYRAKGGNVIWLHRTPESVKARWIFGKNDIEMEVTMQELTKSGVALGKGGDLKETYKRHPRQMLTARLISEAVRLLCPEVVSGIYTPEEVADFSHDREELLPAGQQTEVEQESEEEFKSLLGDAYSVALTFFDTAELSALPEKIKRQIRTRTADLKTKLSAQQSAN